MKFRIIFLSASLVCGQASAINVRDALTSAYQNNQELLEIRQKVIASHEQIVQAKCGFRPRVVAQAKGSVAKGRSKSDSDSLHKNSLSKSQSGSVTVTQNIFSGFSDVAKVSKA